MAMNSASLASRIRRKADLVESWTAEAGRFPGGDKVSQGMRKYCLGMARHANEQKEALLALMRAPSDGTAK